MGGFKVLFICRWMNAAMKQINEDFMLRNSREQLEVCSGTIIDSSLQEKVQK